MAVLPSLSCECGFNYSNCRRNAFIAEHEKHTAPVLRKTGTTIVGLRLDDCVIVGADTRATAGDIVVDKNCEKIHYLAPAIRCCGAGSAADNIHVLEEVAASLRIHAANQRRAPRVAAARRLLEEKLFKYQGHLSVFAIVGGWDPVDGPQLFDIWPHGSSDSELPFQTGGSGMYASLSVFESQYHPHMSREEGARLVIAAVTAGILNDLGSGSNVDFCVLDSHGADYHRNCRVGNVRSFPSRALSLPPTRVLEEARLTLDTLVDKIEQPVSAAE